MPLWKGSLIRAAVGRSCGGSPRVSHIQAGTSATVTAEKTTSDHRQLPVASAIGTANTDESAEPMLKPST